MIQPELFASACCLDSEAEEPRYPKAPGSKSKLGTSQEAAPTISEAAKLQRECLQLLILGEHTADELARLLGKDKLSIRPRVSELHGQGKIEPTDQRRKNASGKGAIVWRAV